MATKTAFPKGGFSFENYQRNAILAAKGINPPSATTTGTTISGLIYKDGVVLGADTRSTSAPTICDKDCRKIHYLAPNMYCCGAGTAADTDATTKLISSQLELHRLATGRQTRLVTAMTLLKRMLFKHHGHIVAALIVGGCDINGPQIFPVHPHGSVDSKIPYIAMGSGSMAAMAVLEAKWRKNMERSEAIELMVEVIEAGIFNDLGSGSNVDIVVLEKDKTEVMPRYSTPNVREQKERSYKFQRGTTAIIKESIYKLVKVVDVDEMDVS